MRRRWALLAAIGVIALTGMSLRSGPLGRIIIRAPIVLLRALLWPERSPAAPVPDVAGVAGSDEAAPLVPVPASADSAPPFGRPDPAPAAPRQQRTGLSRGQASGPPEGDIAASGAAAGPTASTSPAPAGSSAGPAPVPATPPGPASLPPASDPAAPAPPAAPPPPDDPLPLPLPPVVPLPPPLDVPPAAPPALPPAPAPPALPGLPDPQPPSLPAPPSVPGLPLLNSPGP